MGDVYELERIDDLLKVPPEKLEACLRDIHYALELTHLTYGENAPSVSGVWNWTDDDNHSCSITANGKPVIRLDVVDAEDANGCG